MTTWGLGHVLRCFIWHPIWLQTSQMLLQRHSPHSDFVTYCWGILDPIWKFIFIFWKPQLKPEVVFPQYPTFFALGLCFGILCIHGLWILILVTVKTSNQVGWDQSANGVGVLAGKAHTWNRPCMSMQILSDVSFQNNVLIRMTSTQYWPIQNQTRLWSFKLYINVTFFWLGIHSYAPVLYLCCRQIPTVEIIGWVMHELKCMPVLGAWFLCCLWACAGNAGFRRIQTSSVPCACVWVDGIKFWPGKWRLCVS